MKELNHPSFKFGAYLARKIDSFTHRVAETMGLPSDKLVKWQYGLFEEGEPNDYQAAMLPVAMSLNHIDVVNFVDYLKSHRAATTKLIYQDIVEPADLTPIKVDRWPVSNLISLTEDQQQRIAAIIMERPNEVESTVEERKVEV